MEIMEIISWVLTNKVQCLEIIGSGVALASLIAKLTPTTSDNKVVDKVSAILNAVALNPKQDKARK